MVLFHSGVRYFPLCSFIKRLEKLLLLHGQRNEKAENRVHQQMNLDLNTRKTNQGLGCFPPPYEISRGCVWGAHFSTGELISVFVQIFPLRFLKKLVIFLRFCSPY